MLGVRYTKFDPTTYVLRFQNGEIKQQGAGLSFFYFAPSTSLVAIPMGTTDAPFIFEETTGDFQDITIQGQVTYRIAAPEKTAKLLNFTLDPAGNRYVSEDPEKLQQRVVNAIKVLTRTRVEALPLRKALAASATLVEEVTRDLSERPDIVSLGLEILGLSILAIKPNPETARALEAQTREQLQKEADDAIFIRRNASVENERSIKENELLTEKTIQEKQNELETEQTKHEVAIEESRKALVALAAENSRTEAEARAFAVKSVVAAVKDADPVVLQSLVSSGMKPDALIANAFQELARNAERIGELNVSPDLLEKLVRGRRSPANGQ
jgi:regulator of protease activity HflC (stomatin/prohibitin superfamily)